MFLSLIFVAFLFAVIQGFVRVVVYFWEWLSGGGQLASEDVERAETALEESEDVLERGSPERSASAAWAGSSRAGAPPARRSTSTSTT